MVYEGLMIGSMVFMLFFGILAILTMIFWILMIVDAAQRKFKNENDRIMWILIIVLAQIVGALVYYFVVKRNAKK